MLSLISEEEFPRLEILRNFTEFSVVSTDEKEKKVFRCGNRIQLFYHGKKNVDIDDEFQQANFK